MATSYYDGRVDVDRRYSPGWMDGLFMHHADSPFSRLTLYRRNDQIFPISSELPMKSLCKLGNAY